MGENLKNSSFSAVILAAGSGSRMKSETPKQYMDLCGKPLMTYSIETFLRSGVDEIILVVTPGDEEYVEKEILGERSMQDLMKEYGVASSVTIVPGGSERSESVLNGTRRATSDYVLIHDGARAFVTCDVIARMKEAVIEHDACVAAVPEKNTMKMADSSDFVADTIDRSKLWEIQTPQAFRRELLLSAYDNLLSENPDMKRLTDDAMIVEEGCPGQKVKLVMGDYLNLKVTTPEDLILGEGILRSKERTNY